MKKMILFCLMALFSYQSLSAQFGLDVSTGINVHFHSYENLNIAHETDRSSGFYFGVRPKYRFNENLNVGLAVQYSPKGGAFNTPVLEAQTIYKIEYLDFIPSMEYRLLPFFSVGTGLNVGFRLNEKFKTGVNDWDDIEGAEITKSMDVGLVGNVKFNIKNVFLRLSYNHGLTNINDLEFTDVNGEVMEDVEQYNRNFQVGLGYTFDFQK